MVAQAVKNPPATWETQVQTLDGEDPLEREWLPTLVFFPGEFHGQRRFGKTHVYLYVKISQRKVSN